MMNSEETTCPSSSHGAGGECVGIDLFRKKERLVKNFMKAKQQELEHKTKRQKLWKDSEADGANDTAFLWENVVDVRRSQENLELKETLPRCCSPIPHICSSTPTIFKLNCGPTGCFVIKDALCPNQQLYWAKKALEVYSTEEHTNLTNLNKLQNAGDPEVGPKTAEMTNIESDLNNLWRRSISENDNFASFNKLRWSCLGYHYDWTKRSYQKNLKSEFPIDLAEMCQLAATKIDYEFVPEASIVNFYPLNSSMGGHLDDAEHDLTKPIVSISLGRSSIFLMGGRQKTADPIPILARSGDIVIMSGESRYCYHGVPCIISRELEKELCSEVLPNLDECVESPDEDTRHVLRYLQDHRINMNVRQVKIENEIWVEKTGTGHVKYPLY